VLVIGAGTWTSQFRGAAAHTKCTSAVALRIAGNRTTSVPGAVRFPRV